ncbi:MAG: bifunctional phosphopantothenoylcysteine decarboxylase/phosphopantothenate--cysteine ligase CoaBC [Acidobacteria bacterium]|nr:MAG: bifunctional phosphopantothenoylcysteine decarboxylase/phosphopantothenate--cysteine ligase CoaBC [Acidobacteriota bacterium]
MNEKQWKIGLGVCGGIAAYKAVEVLRLLQKSGCQVKVAMTKEATNFINPLTFRALTNEYVLVDDYAADNPDPIAHVNFSQTIDLLLIVPATANILAKFANGIADDFLTSTYLASTAPVIVAPAMNTAMWNHPATQRNIQKLREDRVIFIEPIEGELACKTVGTGKLEDVENIVDQVLTFLRFSVQKESVNSDFSKEHLLITTGGTREEIDPVRYLSNYSSGKMGFAIAKVAKNRGAQVTVIAGSISCEQPKDIKVINVVSAEQMHEAVMQELENATVFIGAAAIADYRPTRRASSKIKKDSEKLILELEKTPDILKEVSQRRHEGLIVVGFAAETENLESYAVAKMRQKELDMIVANDVSAPGCGFGTDNNKGFIVKRNGEKVDIPFMSKDMMADLILDEILKIRNSR